MLNQKILAEYNKIRNTKNTDIFCHAPFTSLNFEQNGNVTACCYNRTHIFGTYPQDTLEAMWFGPKADELRDSMRKNDLPAGCSLCYSQFQSKDFAGLRAQFYDNLADETYAEKNGRFIPMPKVMEFEISNVCNLECTMCNGYYSSAIRKNREKLPPLKNPYDATFIKQLEVFIPHLKEARFLGGEPFLINTFYQIWDLIIQRNPHIKVSITTNGTILNNKVKDVLEKLQACIILSIDSLEKENYEHIRVNARFDEVMEHVQYFEEYAKRKNTIMSFAICPMQQNWQELPHFLEFCNEHNIRLFFNTVLNPRSVSLRTMKKNELSEIVEHLKAIELPEGTQVQTYNSSQYRALFQQIQWYYEQSFESEFINDDSLHEYQILLELFEQKDKFNEQDEIHTLINSTISEILKRFANQKNMGPVEYDQETLEIPNYFFDNPHVFYANEKISQYLETLCHQVGIQRFVKEYINILKIVLSVLRDRGHDIPTDRIFRKFDHMYGLVVSHPANELIMQGIIGSDVVSVLQQFKELSLEQMIQIMNSRYGEYKS